MRAFRAALTFLTRLPVGRLEAGDFARAPGWFAAAGLVIGAAGAGVWWLAAAIWPPVLAALAAVAAMLMITGALHEDGLADAFDGLGSGRPAERAMEIMRDSRIGSFGTLALALVLGARIAALVALGPLAPAAMIAGQGLSRAGMTLMLRRGPYLRAQGTGSGMTGPLGAGAWPLALAALAAAALTLWSGGWALAPALLGLVLAMLVLRGWAIRRLGGLTGDILGAAQVLGDLGFLLGWLAWP
ncbi:MAG: adenosylcobinamide-GDP ribazoletransferase [Rhodobacter sp.]|uniref:adenosylcobinamide-GDP ribazoletransferase n=1 Tax=Pararhodobacter sp. TaxID=2127056 RepID=UPI002C79717D|nr:adenosylcobinamide-GDP ribazoletransferase [Pararhodobacter sp.]MCC0074283.1 adenosylcobinamide-GDP ribazoletransferase [Rhodobacter sp.]HPD92795.1 adenosylcobinamide-GDP ribazoletransferase [Pararhodobacter sp.]